MGFLKNLFSGTARTVRADPAGIEFAVAPGQSILEAALAQGIAFPHSCTVGTCGSCKCTLVSGKIREIANFAYVLTAVELQSGIILACQAAPRSDLTLNVVGLSRKQLTPASDFIGTLVTVADLTHDIKQIEVLLDRPIKFDAGQYVQLSVPGLHGARAYSLAQAPQADGNKRISLFIRHVQGGQFTDLLFSGELDQQQVKVHGPAGNFWLRDSRAPMITIAGGSGLAPLLSILEDAVARQVGRPCLVLFGARTAADLYCENELAAIGRGWNGAFKFIPVLSDEPAASAWSGARGLVTERLAIDTTDFLSADTEAYLCGPPPMIDAALPLLSDLGLTPANIHFDKFLDGSHGLQRAS